MAQMTDKLILSELYQLPENLKAEVLHFIAFLKQEQKQKTSSVIPKDKRVFGKSKGKYTLSADFDAPLDDLKEYM